MIFEKPIRRWLLKPSITGAHKAMNPTVTCNLLKALVLVLFLIGWKTGVRFLSQSLNIITILKLLLRAIGKLFCSHFSNKSIRKVECRRSEKGSERSKKKVWSFGVCKYDAFLEINFTSCSWCDISSNIWLAFQLFTFSLFFFFLHNYVVNDMEIAVKANIKGMWLCFLYDYYFFLYL